MVRDIHTKNNVPFGFGSANPRFVRIGLHPELDAAGTLKKITSKGGPGQYDAGFIRCLTKKTTKDSVWSRMVELEEFSKFLGFRNASILAEREFQKTHRGPGTYEIPDDIDKPKTYSILENNGFSAEKRFRSPRGVDFPPPDTYFRNIHTKRNAQCRCFGNIPIFEWDGLQPRFKDTEPRFRRPPNLYRVKDPNSLEALMKRVVSLKGPYNLFTGKRDGSSIKNHFAPPHTNAPDIFHVEPSDLDRLLHHPTKRRCGKFLKEERFPKKHTARMLISDPIMCYKDPDHPGPGHYDSSNQSSIRTAKPEMYPFGSSNIYQRPPTQWQIHPGPGRYNIKNFKCGKAGRASSVFLTKTRRSFFVAKDI